MGTFYLFHPISKFCRSTDSIKPALQASYFFVSDPTSRLASLKTNSFNHSPKLSCLPERPDSSSPPAAQWLCAHGERTHSLRCDSKNHSHLLLYLATNVYNVFLSILTWRLAIIVLHFCIGNPQTVANFNKIELKKKNSESPGLPWIRILLKTKVRSFAPFDSNNLEKIICEIVTSICCRQGRSKL